MSHPCPDWFSCPAATRPETPGGPCWSEGMAAQPRCPCLPWLPSETRWGPRGPPLRPHVSLGWFVTLDGQPLSEPWFPQMGDTCFKPPSQSVLSWPVRGEGASSQEGMGTGWDLGKGPGVSRDGGVAGVWRAGGGGGPSHFTRSLGDRGARISVGPNTGTRVCRTLRRKHLRPG